MRIFDQNGIELNELDIDNEKGRLTPERIFVKHHDAIEAVEEQGHWDVIAEYPNGGKDVKWVVDVEAVAPVEAYDEYEDILRYIPYTEEELEDARKNSPEYRIAQLEQTIDRLLNIMAKNGLEVDG